MRRLFAHCLLSVIALGAVPARADADEVEESSRRSRAAGEPEEIARTVLFLATDGSYLTAAELVVSGGMSDV